MAGRLKKNAPREDDRPSRRQEVPAISSCRFSIRCFALATISALAACNDVLKPEDVVLTVVAPQPGDSVLAGDSITLSATLVDRSGATLAGIPITWSTSGGQTLGEGLTLRAVLTDAGTYDVIARADLGDGGAVTASAAVTILHNGAPSLVAVQIPTRLYVHDTVQLTAAGADHESSVVRIEWYGDGNTLLGVRDTIAWSPGMPVGSHAVTVRVLDPQGNHTDSVVSVRALSDEHVLWLADGGAWSPRAPVVAGDGILALADDGAILVGFNAVIVGSCGTHCLFSFAPDGALRWQRTLDDQFSDHSSGLTLAPDGTVFVFDFQGNGYGLSADGIELWERHLLGQDPHGRFALDPAGRLYAAGNTAGGMAVVRLDPATGTDVWRQTFSGGYAAGPSVLPDSTLTVQASVTFRHLDPDGNAVGDTLVTTHVAHYLSAADARGYTYLRTDWLNGSLLAVGPDNTVRWEVAFPHRPGEPVVDADTVIYSAAYVTNGPAGQSEVQAIGPDGSVRWTQTVSGASDIPRFAILADGTLYVAVGYYLHTLSRATGTILKTIEFPVGIYSSLAVAPNGTVYLVTGDGRLEALRGTVPLDPNAPWPIWRRDDRRTASVPH
jgi:outer membrane protein assembly factor BamB